VRLTVVLKNRRNSHDVSQVGARSIETTEVETKQSTRDLLITRYYLMRSRLLNDLLTDDKSDEEPCSCYLCHRKATP
jgi:hypothetical protein